MHQYTQRNHPVSVSVLPRFVRDALREIGVRRVLGVQIDPWVAGARYKTGDYVIYCEGESVVSVRKKTQWVWRAKNREDL